MGTISFDYSKSFIGEHEMIFLNKQVELIHNMLHTKNCNGSDFTGWMDFANRLPKAEIDRIREIGQNIKKTSQALIVIGIGGSYLGARAAIELLGGSEDSPSIYFAGNNLSGRYLKKLFDKIKGLDISICVISKSGTTTEPAIAFRFFKKYIEDKYGKKEAAKRIYAITDIKKGALKKLSDTEGYESFIIPDDIGGRYSVLTPVGLLPMAAAGIDINSIIQGASEAYHEYDNKSLTDNPCYQYAAVRNLLYRRGKVIEVMATYEPDLQYFCEWWKQLFGESEGKDGKGIFPASVQFTTDLHSLGQLMQDGARNIFETVLNIEENDVELYIKKEEDDIDGLNYLSGKSVDFVNKKAYEGTVLAHNDGGVPILNINIPKLDEYHFGKLIYFFEKSCALSGHILGINPFDQPGVELYKKNMFRLLGKNSKGEI